MSSDMERHQQRQVTVGTLPHLVWNIVIALSGGGILILFYITLFCETGLSRLY